MQVEAGRIRLDYRNLKGCTLNFYPMDIELLFSRSPFLQDGAAQFSFIRPVADQSVELPAGKEMLAVDLPKEFHARNVMVEALAAGLRKTQAYYANTLKVQLIEAYGQLAVTHAETRKPVPGAYVKVYMKTKAGEVKFFKDGYTDLRGRFDYASLNTNELDNAERLAVLVLSPDLGAVVREAAPPKAVRGTSSNAVSLPDLALLRRFTLDRSSVGVNPSPVPIVPGGTGAFVAHRAVTGGLARYLATDPVHIIGIVAWTVNIVAPAAVAPLREVIIAGLFALSNLGMTENALRIRKIL